MRADIAFSSATALASKLRAGKVSALELLDHYIARVEKHDGALNAVVVRDFERARKRAKAADRALRKGESWGPLHGVPMTVKESFNVEGLKTTWGNPAFKDSVANYTSVAIERLQAAGVVVFGKTNVPLLLQDLQSYNAIYGTTHNPYDLARTPGGSSGGGAAAVAAGLSAADFGSDLAGSVRVPSSFCGVYGHKPSFGIVPTRGHSLTPALATPDLSVLGPIARSARDLEPFLRAVAGPLEEDAAGWVLKLPASRAKSVKGLRIGLLTDVDMSPIANSVRTGLESLTGWLRKKGAKVTAAALPIDPQTHQAMFGRFMRGVTAARMNDAMFQQTLADAAKYASDDMNPPAVAARGLAQYHRDWCAAHEARMQLRAAWADYFRDHDLLLIPGTPVPAFPIDESGARDARKLDIDGCQVPYNAQGFWQGIATVSYLPATIAPIGRTPEGLPVSVQAVGPYLGDLSTIGFARLLEQDYAGYTPPAAFAA
jgi:amidase